MRFKSESEATSEWVAKKPEKTKWFAWYPVKINDQTVWLEHIYRTRTKIYIRSLLHTGYEKDYDYELIDGGEK